jgi:hypothetical protein
MARRPDCYQFAAEWGSSLRTKFNRKQTGWRSRWLGVAEAAETLI